MLVKFTKESEFHIFINLKNRAINKKIDHIVYVVSDLKEAINEFEQKFGVRPIFGGYHKTFGTKNALINLKDKMYLELLAADDSNTDIAAPRWMGIDFLTKNQITRWALKSDSLETDAAILKKYNTEMGEIRNGSRNAADGTLLQWELSMPLESPEVEVVPFLLDWSKTEKHPSELMPNMDCELLELYATHPKPDTFISVFKSLGFAFDIKHSKEIAIKTVIKCPNGIVEL